METLILRVRTGEDVLCRATKNDAGYSIQDAMALVPTPDGRLAFVGWMPYVDSKDGIQLPHDFVTLPYFSPKTVGKLYKNTLHRLHRCASLREMHSLMQKTALLPLFAPVHRCSTVHLVQMVQRVMYCIKTQSQFSTLTPLTVQ